MNEKVIVNFRLLHPSKDTTAAAAAAPATLDASRDRVDQLITRPTCDCFDLGFETYQATVVGHLSHVRRPCGVA